MKKYLFNLGKAMKKTLIYIRLIYSLSLILIGCNLTAQSKQDYTWIFGANASTELPNAEGTLISFNGEKVDTSYQELPVGIGLNNASICDKDGELLFYTNGCDIYNRNFEIMENGQNINPGEVHIEYCDTGQYGALQNTLILEDPSNEKGYYIYHKPIKFVDLPTFHISAYEVLYSYVDFSENTLGKVIQKNIVMDEGRRHLSSFNEAIKHANGKDWWIIDFTEEDSLILWFQIDENGIFLEKETESFNIKSQIFDCSGGGQSCFSPDGKMYAKYCSESGLDVFDFDRETAELSNYRNLLLPSELLVSGLAISPNSRFAYVSNFWTLYQIDLWEENLEDGVVLIDSFDLHFDPLPTNFALMQLAPDCRIYMNSTNFTRSMHVIHQPNEKGKNCWFQQHTFKVPYGIRPASFPNFPHFRIDEEDVCDPTISSLFDLPIFNEGNMSVYPNPSDGNISIEFAGSRSGVIQVLDMTGKRLSKRNFKHQDKFDLDLSHLHNGMYFVEFLDIKNMNRMVEKLVISNK